MPITYNGQLFQDIKLVAPKWTAAVAQAVTDHTDKAAHTLIVAEATGRTVAHEGLAIAGNTLWDDGINGDAQIQADVLAYYQRWLVMAQQYMNANGSFTIASADERVIIPILLGAMATDGQTLDASAPTIGAISYTTISNQGDGTATIAINSNTTLAELALAGKIVLTCRQAGFDNQNTERWELSWVGVNHRTGDVQTRVSQRADFYTGTRYYDVVSAVAGIYDDPTLQIPQRGRSIHTGVNVLISTPAYNTVVESGDADVCCSAYNFMAKVGTKTNLSRKNVTFQGGDADGNGAVYLHIAKDGANYAFWFAQDVAGTIHLSETQTYTVATGAGVKSFLTATTNPEHTSNGGHLSTTDVFAQVTVNPALLTVSAVITIQANLPWAAGDVIEATVTNAYGGALERLWVQEFGYALPVNNAGAETITDP